MGLLEHLRARVDAMVAATSELVSVESPSADLDATGRCGNAVADLVREMLGTEPDRITTDGPTHLAWSFGPSPTVLLVGHLDTVWPSGTLARWPFSVKDGVATGPGVFDMKGGIVQGVFALDALREIHGDDATEHVQLLVTADEETGSHSSRAAIESLAAGKRAALVLEPSASGALKTARKGASMYTLDVEGRAAHAGLEPDKGVNALVELAHAVLAITELARPDLGTTVTPTVATAGTATNVVPATASLRVDARAATVAEQQRVDDAMHALAGSPRLAGARIRVTGGPNRPPLDASASRDLFALAQRVARDLGLDEPLGVEVGGGSDGNFTAGVGVPTLDGLGAVGDGAHAEGEHILVAAMPERAALLAGLIAALRP